MTPEQIRQRFLLIEQLDFWIPLVVLLYLLVLVALTVSLRIEAKDQGDKGWWRLLDATGYMLTFGVLAYYFWRTFYAFY